MTKNRIHQLIDRNHIKTSNVNNLFRVTGRKFLQGLRLSGIDQKLLKNHLELLDTLYKHSKYPRLKPWHSKQSKLRLTPLGDYTFTHGQARGTLPFGLFRKTETWIEKELKDSPFIGVLNTLPGFGKILSALATLEIDDISRFQLQLSLPPTRVLFLLLSAVAEKSTMVIPFLPVTGG